MNKYLHITEYSKFGKIPQKQNNEYDLFYGNSIIRSGIVKNKTKEQIKESIDPYYNMSKLEENIIDLNDVIIYSYNDDIPTKIEQKLSYVYECPVCLNVIITPDSDFDVCPFCENMQFPFNLIAIINNEQTKDLSQDDEIKSIKLDNDKIIINKTDSVTE